MQTWALLKFAAQMGRSDSFELTERKGSASLRAVASSTGCRTVLCVSAAGYAAERHS